jgi:hypothetical protein
MTFDRIERVFFTTAAAGLAVLSLVTRQWLIGLMAILFLVVGLRDLFSRSGPESDD